MTNNNLESYKNLVVWQKAIDLSLLTYAFTKKLPKAELFGIISQMNRAAVSMPANIAEGYKRNNRKEYIQFLGIANGSAAELETFAILCSKLFSNVKGSQEVELNSVEIQKILTVMIRKLQP